MSSFAPLAPLLRTSMFGSIRPGRPLNRYRTAGRVGGGVPAGAPRTLAAFQQVQRFATGPDLSRGCHSAARNRCHSGRGAHRRQGLGWSRRRRARYRRAQDRRGAGPRGPRMLAPDVDPGALDRSPERLGRCGRQSRRAAALSRAPAVLARHRRPAVPHAVTTGGGGITGIAAAARSFALSWSDDGTGLLLREQISSRTPYNYVPTRGARRRRDPTIPYGSPQPTRVPSAVSTRHDGPGGFDPGGSMGRSMCRATVNFSRAPDFAGSRLSRQSRRSHPMADDGACSMRVQWSRTLRRPWAG